MLFLCTLKGLHAAPEARRLMLKGRLGLETARMPHADRHGLIWFERGELCVIDGCLHFFAGKDSLKQRCPAHFTGRPLTSAAARVHRAQLMPV